MPRMKFCGSCGKIIPDTIRCECKIQGDRARNKKRNDRYKEDKKFLNSKEWRELRERIIKRDKEVCIRCYVIYNEIVREGLEVHHIKPRIYYPELKLDETNLITLCKSCNTTLGTKGKLDFEYEITRKEPVL